MAVTPKAPAVVTWGTDAGVETTMSSTGTTGRDVTTVLTLPAHFITV